MANSFTYGGRDFTTYPLPVYGAWLRRSFGYLFGFAFVAYLPALALLDRSDPFGVPTWLGWCSPVAAAGAGAVAVSVGAPACGVTGVRVHEHRHPGGGACHPRRGSPQGVHCGP